MASLQLSNLRLEKILLEEKHFAIGTIHLPPFISYMNVSADGRINDAIGFIHEIIIYMATKYHFNFEYIKPIDGAYGSFENGSWNGLVGMLFRKELDLVAACLVVTYPRSRAIDFSVQYFNDQVSLLIPYPTLDNAINGITRPFQFMVWLLTFISVLAVSTALWKIFSTEFRTTSNYRNVRRPSLYESVWSLLDFRNTGNRLHTANSSRLPVRLVAAGWFLAGFVLMNAYSSTLISYLMTLRYYPMIDSIEDIASTQRPVFMVTKSTSYETAVLNAKDGVLLKIGDSLRKYPELRINSTRELIIESVIKNQRSFTTVRSSLLDTMEKDFKKTGQCRLSIAKKPWDTARAAFAFQKSSQLTPIFDTQINWLRDVGLLNYWERRFWPHKNRCTEPLSTTQPDVRERPLTFNALSSAFILLGCGLVASFTVFLVELTHFRIVSFGGIPIIV